MLDEVSSMLRLVEAGAAPTGPEFLLAPYDSSAYCLKVSRRLGPLVTVRNALVRVTPAGPVCLYESSTNSQIRDFLVHEAEFHTDIVMCGVSQDESRPSLNGWIGVFSPAAQSLSGQPMRIIYTGTASIRSMCWLPGMGGRCAIAGDYAGNLILIDLTQSESTVVGRSSSSKAIRTISAYREFKTMQTVLVCGLADTAVELLTTNDLGRQPLVSKGMFKLTYDPLHTAVLQQDQEFAKLAIADSGGNVSIFEHDGRVVWKSNCGGKVLSLCAYPPVKDEPQKLIAGTSKGGVICISDQQVEWSYKVGNCVFGMDVDVNTEPQEPWLANPTIWVVIDEGRVRCLAPVDRRSCTRDAKKCAARVRTEVSTEAYLDALREAGSQTAGTNRTVTCGFIADELVRVIKAEGRGIKEFLSLALKDDPTLCSELCSRLHMLPRDHLEMILSHSSQAPMKNILVTLLTLMPEREEEIVRGLHHTASAADDHELRLAEKAEKLLANADRDGVERCLKLLDEQDGVDLAWVKSLDSDPSFFRLGSVDFDDFSAFAQTSADFKLHRVSRNVGSNWSSPVDSPITGVCFADVSGSDKQEVLISTVDGRIIAINSTTGEQIWQLRFSARVMAFEVTESPFDSHARHMIVALQTGELYHGHFLHGEPPMDSDITLVGSTLRPIRTIKIRPISATMARVVWLQSDCSVSSRDLNLTERKFVGKEVCVARSGLPLRLIISNDNKYVYVATNVAIYRHLFSDILQHRELIVPAAGQFMEFGPILGVPDDLAIYTVQSEGLLTLYNCEGCIVEERRLSPSITRPVVFRPASRKPVQLVGYVRNEIRNWHLQKRDWIQRIKADAISGLSDREALERVPLFKATGEQKTWDMLEHVINYSALKPVVYVVPCWTPDDRTRLLDAIASLAPQNQVRPENILVTCGEARLLVVSKSAAVDSVLQTVRNGLAEHHKSTIVLVVGTGARLTASLNKAGIHTQSCGLWQYAPDELIYEFRKARVNQPEALARMICAATIGIPTLVIELLTEMTACARAKDTLTAIAAAETCIIRLYKHTWSNSIREFWEHLDLLEQIEISAAHLVPEQAEVDVEKMVTVQAGSVIDDHHVGHVPVLEALGLKRSRTHEELVKIHLPVWPWSDFLQQHGRVSTIVLNRLAELPRVLAMSHIADLARSLDAFPEAFECLSQRSLIILKMASAWQRLRDGLGAGIRAPLQELLSGIADLCSLELWAVETEEESGLPFGLLDMESVGLRCTVDTLWAFIPHGKERALPILLEKRRANLSDPVFILTPNDTVLPARLDNSLIVLREADVVELISSSDQTKTNVFVDWLIDRMTKTLPLEVISPYHSGDRPSMAVFVGRQEHLETLRNAATGNAILIGPRRAGKTSILYRLGQVARRDRKRSFGQKDTYRQDEWFRPVYLDFSTTTARAVYRSLILRIGGDGDTVFDLAQRLRYLRRFENAQILFLVDEVDKLFKEDHDRATELFWQLRGLANENLCRFVCAGFLDLYAETTNKDSSFFNFGREVFVGSLTEAEAHQLISAPMERLRIELQDKAECLRYLSYETTNHPGYIHKVCEQLIQMLASDGTRQITKEKCEKAIENVHLPEVFKDTFQDLDALEQMILTIFTDGKDWHKRLTLKQVAADAKLQGLGCPHSMVRKALRSCVMAGFLAVRENLYYLQSEKLCRLARDLSAPWNEQKNRVKEAVRRFELL